jgi:hypothetical protein
MSGFNGVILEFSDVMSRGKNCIVSLNQRSKYEKVLEKMGIKNAQITRRTNSSFKMRTGESESSSSPSYSNLSQK